MLISKASFKLGDPSSQHRTLTVLNVKDFAVQISLKRGGHGAQSNRASAGPDLKAWFD